MTTKKLVVRSATLLLLVLLTWSCATDYDQIDQSTLATRSDYIFKKMHFDDFEKSPKLKNVIEKIGQPSILKSRQLYQSPFGFTVDLDEFVYIGNEKVHSYTFEVLNEKDPSKVQNLVLKHMPDETYEAFLLTYSLTDDDMESIASGKPLRDFTKNATASYVPYNQPAEISANISISYDCVTTIIGQTYTESWDENGVGTWEAITYYQVDCTWTITIGGGGGGGGGGTGGGGTGGGGTGGGTGGGGTGGGGTGGGGGSIGGGGGGGGGTGGGGTGGGGTGSGGGHGTDPNTDNPFIVGGPHQPGFSLNDGSNPVLTVPILGFKDHVKALNKLTKNKSDGSKTQVRGGIDDLRSRLLTETKEMGYHFIDEGGGSFSVREPVWRGPNLTKYDQGDQIMPGTKVVMHMHQKNGEVRDGLENGLPKYVLVELSPIFSGGDIDKTAEQFMDVGKDSEFTSILVSVEGEFALRVGNSADLEATANDLQDEEVASNFFNDYKAAVDDQSSDNASYVSNFAQFLGTYQLNGHGLGLVLYKAVVDSQGNITNWQKI